MTEPRPRQITLDTIREAAATISGVARRTTLIPVDLAGPAKLFLKLETLQPIGSFKIRGAYNAVRGLTQDELDEGVWTVSAGNAAQGVAFAARSVGAACAVLVVDSAPQTKITAIERLGARVVRASYDSCWRTVERHLNRLPGHLIHPFDDDRFISGNGTVGLEIVDDLPAVDAVVASVGGGGLLAGLATAVRALRPGTRVYAAEPETAALLARSLKRGTASRFDEWRPSFVDGCGGQSITPTMWPLLRDLVDDSIVVGLDDIKTAMRLVADRTHVIMEGAAGCAVAAALSGRIGTGNIAVIVSGGNVDLSTFAGLVARQTATDQ